MFWACENQDLNGILEHLPLDNILLPALEHAICQDMGFSSVSDGTPIKTALETRHLRKTAHK